MISRRSLLKAMAGGVVLAGAMGSYAFGFEPRFRLIETRYRIRTPRLDALNDESGRPLRIAVLADFHACEPWMPLTRIAYIVRRTNALQPDLIVLLGDFVAGLKRFRSAIVPMASWAAALAELNAPLGTFAVLGNHDWWVDAPAATGHLTSVGIPVLENTATMIERPEGGRFWLAGLGDQLAIPIGGGRFRGVDDLAGTMAQIGDQDSAVVLLAHEPDIFPEVQPRVDLTLSGHTHGGQVRLPFVGAPVVPSRYGQRYAQGHIVEDGRQLVVSAGLGCSMLPVRFGVPPEIVIIETG
ncbi:metallophosphoesterase [Nitratireductor sp. XY-223]|uniref:metallophosphoesterase n=1 Tax=Nitratireductor sp. XY-223 TaxID=2561926 RepID=UPI0010A9D2C0|nr:metallophosphoesterase [Nitratireductor sp. XY-223]